jgi:hypothetical protein
LFQRPKIIIFPAEKIVINKKISFKKSCPEGESLKKVNEWMNEKHYSSELNGFCWKEKVKGKSYRFFLVN